MSNYSKTTDFAAKDALSTGNANKIVKGTEIDDEFDAIQTAVNSKADTNNTALTGTPTAPTAGASVNTTQLSTTAYVTSAITTAVAATKEALFPVGTIYTQAAVSTNPATLLGFGTWAAFGAGKVMVGLDSGDTDFDTLEETGGSKTHTLTVGEIPSHTHNIVTFVETGSPDGGVGGDASSTTLGSQNTESTGGGGAHNNLQPYIVVYMWKRTA